MASDSLYRSDVAHLKTEPVTMPSFFFEPFDSETERLIPAMVQQTKINSIAAWFLTSSDAHSPWDTLPLLDSRLHGEVRTPAVEAGGRKDARTGGH